MSALYASRLRKIVGDLAAILLILSIIAITPASAFANSGKTYIQSRQANCTLTKKLLTERFPETKRSNWYILSPHRAHYSGKYRTFILKKDEFGYDVSGAGDYQYHRFAGEELSGNDLIFGCYNSKGPRLYTYDMDKVCLDSLDAVRQYFGGADEPYWFQTFDPHQGYIPEYVYQAPRGHALTFDTPLSTKVRIFLPQGKLNLTPGYRVTSRTFSVRYYHDCSEY